MNRDQWALLHRLKHGWQVVSLLADFPSAREHLIQGQGGSSGVVLSDGRETWGRTTRKGLEAYTFTLDEADDIRNDVYTETVHVTLTWREIRAWVDSQPRSVVEQARALRREWGAICHERARYWTPGNQLGPSHADKTVYGPRTWAAQLSIDCDRWEVWHRAYENALCCSLAPSDEPADLLELLEVAG